jgi:hypothetical protein
VDKNTNQGYGVKIINDRPGNGKLEFVKIIEVEARGFRWAGIYVGGIPTDLPEVKNIQGYNKLIWYKTLNLKGINI